MLYLVFMAVLINGRNVLCRWFAGWNKLERHFPRGKPEHIGLVSKGSYLLVSGAVSFVPMHFNVEVCRDFLWLRPAALGMKGISIAWDAMENVSLAHGLLGTVGTVTLKDVDVTLRISGRAAVLAYEVWQTNRSTQRYNMAAKFGGYAAVYR